MYLNLSYIFLHLTGLGINLCQQQCGKYSACQSVVYDVVHLTCGLSNSSVTSLRMTIGADHREGISYHEKEFSTCPGRLLSGHHLVCFNNRYGRSKFTSDDVKTPVWGTKHQAARPSDTETPPIIRNSTKQRSPYDTTDHIYSYAVEGRLFHFYQYIFKTDSWRQIFKLTLKELPVNAVVDSRRRRFYIGMSQMIYFVTFEGTVVNRTQISKSDGSTAPQMFLDKYTQQLFYLSSHKRKPALKRISVGPKQQEGVLHTFRKGVDILPDCLMGYPQKKKIFVVVNRDTVWVMSISYGDASKPISFIRSFFPGSEPSNLVMLPSYELLGLDANGGLTVYNMEQKTKQKTITKERFEYIQQIAVFENKILIACSTKSREMKMQFIENGQSMKYSYTYQDIIVG